MTIPHLESAPIFEVVCGVAFVPLAALDPMLLGVYWKERCDRFPRRELHPAVADAGVVFFGTQSRVWMISEADDLVLQIQNDRFYLNWRRRGADYPRFGDHPELGPGKSEGLLSKTLDEFELFSAFCEKAIDVRPAPLRVELGKIDHLVEHRHWRGLADLAELLPWFKTFAAFHKSELASFGVQFTEPRAGGQLQVVLASGNEPSVTPGQPPPRMVNMQAHMRAPLDPAKPNLRPAFEVANMELNDVFEKLIPASQHHRFRKGGLT